MTNSQAPLTILRESVRQLDQPEKLALATFLTGTSNPKFQATVTPEDQGFSPNMAKAMEVARTFPSATKIFFAIELLETHLDRDAFEEEEEEEEEEDGE